MKESIKKYAAWAVTLALLQVGAWPVTPALAADKSDFALLDQEPTVADKTVQCGALKSEDLLPKAVPFTLHITMTNRSDSGIGGMNGFVRVKYHDGDFVDYAIPVNTTLQISLAGGGTLGVDDAIQVGSKGGAKLIGQISIIGKDLKPFALISTTSLCTTTPLLGTSPVLTTPF